MHEVIFLSAVPSSPQRGLADRMFLEGPATRISTCKRFFFVLIIIVLVWFCLTFFVLANGVAPQSNYCATTSLVFILVLLNFHILPQKIKMKICKYTSTCAESKIVISSSDPDSDHALPLRSPSNIRHYIQNLKVIDNQRKLTQLSRTIEC